MNHGTQIVDTTTTDSTHHQDDDNNNNNNHHSRNSINFPPSSEWTYYCEGGKHAVFSYTGNTYDWMGKLLRVDKAIFRQCSTGNNIDEHKNNIHNDIQSQVALQVNLSLDDDQYRHRIYQILFPYVDQPYMIHCSNCINFQKYMVIYMASLRDNAMATQRIPPRRRKDWVVSPTTTTTTTTTTTSTSTSSTNTATSITTPDETKMSYESTNTTTSTSTTGLLLLQDYRLLSTLHTKIMNPNNTITEHHPSICIELKPKCGFTTISPLTKCRNKYYTSRYVLQQTLYQTRQLTKDWMMITLSNESKEDGIANTQNETNDTTTFQVSQYDPLDLFSNDPTRIQNAIRHLMSCPQNNFKFWYQNQLLIGLPVGTATPSNCTNTTDEYQTKVPYDWRCLGQSMGIPMPTTESGGQQDVLNFIVDLTTNILVKDEFLQRLLCFQKLDILDTDGAMAVYHRLMVLCHYNETLVESIVDAPIQWMENYVTGTTTFGVEHDTTDTMRNDIPVLLKHCPIQLPQIHSNIIQLCNQMDAVVGRLSSSHSIASLSTEQLDIYRRHAHTIINVLSIEECCYLLQTWLFSISMCDVTFFLNLQFVPTNDDTNHTILLDHDYQNGNTDDGSRFRIIQRPMDDIPGYIQYYNIMTNAYQHIQYQIKVIDIDRKPVKKIQSRYAKERQFDNV